MATIIYSKKITDTKGYKLTSDVLKEAFNEAITINKKLTAYKKRIAYFFIDPLLNSFEAANDFYFNILGCHSISKINTYKSGASPVQTLCDAKELIDEDLYDAVFIFGYDPLLTNKHVYGKNTIQQAMDIFNGKSILECYNLISHRMCEEMGISKEFFLQLTDDLYRNYLKTYVKNTNQKVTYDRGRMLENLKGDLFRMTDCANPNIDFAGGVILANDQTANLITLPYGRVKVSGTKYNMVKGTPESIDKLVGQKNNLFAHLRSSFSAAQEQAKINVFEEFRKGNLCLEVYTCYPPIPLAFLLTTEMVESILELPEFLLNHEITVTGGMNLNRAPWNNSALNSLIEMCNTMIHSGIKYGLVHGNGGIGEIQGVAILEKV
ncbi:hypothetical protein [Desulfosporosinus nitroreducens]|uniref:hypothetical protein n=1 Tax=Desulfosporosinus nitroreducens TaxID=2018668 RepID=UPI00207D6470|nr:hypothetical protein [Desulfosporosinus nitroreducens]MCO1602841.1 hypothetical protein [Desulfosporosinus nitroreducens]